MTCARGKAARPATLAAADVTGFFGLVSCGLSITGTEAARPIPPPYRYRFRCGLCGVGAENTTQTHAMRSVLGQSPMVSY